MIAPDGSYASHHTAAALWGAVAPETQETHISVPGTAHPVDPPGHLAHRADPSFAVVHHRGLPVAEPAAVFMQMAVVPGPG